MKSLLRAPWALALIVFGLHGCSDDATDLTCSSDADCRGTERCIPSGVCQLDVECVAAEECSSADPRTTCDLETFACTFLEGFGDECGTGRPCPFGQFCSNLLGRCLDSGTSRDCVRRSQCPANQICDREANKCIPDPGCVTDAFCEEGEVCDVVNRSCRTVGDGCVSCAVTACPEQLLCSNETLECVTLEGEPLCRQGETCDPLGRCVQCTSDDDCGPGTFCNGSVGQCESNIQCADDPSDCPTTAQVTCIVCELPEVCDSRTKRCTAPPTPCDSDLDCPNDQLCDLALSPSVCVPRAPSCLDDLFDDPPNNDAASARDLPEASGSTFDELKLCPGDEDWYRIDVAAGTFLTVDARFRHLEGDLELQLFLEDGTTLVDQSRSTTDNERVELEVGTDLTLFARTFLGTQTVRPLDYRLVIGRDPGAACADDGAEPNDGPGEANQLLFGTPFEGRLCPADPDWFSLRAVPAGARVILDLDFVDGLGNLDLEVYRAGGTIPLLSSRGTSDGERLELDTPYGGDFFVRVVGESADTNVYTLRATLLPGQGGRCVDDVNEPNDGPSTSTPNLPLGVDQTFSLCGGDEDWFAVDVNAFEVVTAELGFDGLADLDLSLHPPGTTDRNASPLRASTGLAPREYLSFRSFETGRFLVRVYGARTTDAADYVLRIDKPSTSSCAPDANDLAMLGNDQATAVSLGFPPVREAEATLCGGDEDWYQVFVRGGFDNIFRLQYPSSLATLDFELLDFEGNVIFSSVGQTLDSLRTVNVDVPGNGVGVVVVRVLSTNGGVAPYSLSVDLTPTFECEEDREEPNETAAAASTTTSTTTSPIRLPDLSLCPNTRRPIVDIGDEDWFVLTPPAAGTRMEATIDFEQGDLLLELLSPGGLVRACNNMGGDRCLSDGSGLSERVVFTATTTDPYFLRVSSVFSAAEVPARPPEADTKYSLEIRYGGM
ncbi:MAG: hypothetical protein AAFZ18_19430 [Myxococcota bacterium]